MILQFILLIACVIIFSLKRNKDAIIFAIGFGTAALTGVSELVWYYVKGGNYDLFYWKWALVVFILSLIVILGRRLAQNHQQVVKYSRELELFNNELQRSEKMEIISELAASVAHEVRNPLQVTRGSSSCSARSRMAMSGDICSWHSVNWTVQRVLSRIS